MPVLYVTKSAPFPFCLGQRRPSVIISREYLALEANANGNTADASDHITGFLYKLDNLLLLRDNLFFSPWTSARRNFAAVDDDNDDLESENAGTGAGADTEDHAIDHVDTDDVLMFCCFSILVGRIFPGFQESHYETK